jgi:hypothetical protein
METNNAIGEPVDSMWFWISLPHATFAIHVTDGKVDSAPPIGGCSSIGMKAEEVIEALLLIKDSRIIRMEDYAQERKSPSLFK